MDTINQQMTIELGPEVAHGKYSNLAVITHSETEFVLDFAAIMPGCKKEVVSRIIMTPENAKKLHAALGENIENNEKKFGPVGIGRAAYSIAKNNQNKTKS